MKEDILQVINEDFMELLLDMSTRTHKRHTRNSKTPKIKNMRRQRNK
jgi:hypothetical protein